MGLLDKFKDLFTDVEEVEETKVIEEEATPPEENKLPTFMREKIEREEQEKIIPLEQPKEEDSLLKPNNSFRFPIDYDDDDDAFLVRKETREEKVARRESKREELPVKPKVELYAKSAKEKEKKEEKKFVASPIISPVYGVLDKNYHQDELRAKEEDSYELQRPSKKLDFESVRKKAFGTLSDDIKDNMMCENCEFFKELKENAKIEQINEDDLLYEMTEDDKIEDNKVQDDNITIDEAAENYYDFGVAYEPTTSSGVSDKDNDDVVIVNHNDEESQASKIEVKEEEKIDEDNDVLISDDILETKEAEVTDTPLEDLELTDDLYNLIDSMYVEKEDKND